MNEVMLDQCSIGDYIRWWEKGKKFSEGGRIIIIYTPGPGSLNVACHVVITNSGKERCLQQSNIETIINYGQMLKSN